MTDIAKFVDHEYSVAVNQTKIEWPLQCSQLSTVMISCAVSPITAALLQFANRRFDILIEPVIS